MTNLNEVLTATFTADGITVIRDLVAGISGPVADGPVSSDLDEADDWLASKGYERAAGWTCNISYKGLQLTAPLVRAVS